MPDSEPVCLIADYKKPEHAVAIIDLMQEYAQSAMGGGKPLSEYVAAHLVSSLDSFHGAFTVLAFIDSNPAGLITCIPGFSTFNCKPLINIHDLIVSEPFRGHKLSITMLGLVEKEARKRGCCKLTLEVLEGNPVAQKVYQQFGFKAYELDPEMGKAMFWDKKL